MNIGFFTDSYRPYTSGVVRSIETFSREFTARGHEVYVFGPDYPLMHCPKEEKVFRFISIPAPTMPDFAMPIPISVQLGSTIRRIGLDIIHVHSPFLLGRLGARAAHRYKLPLVFTFHTLYDQYVHYLPFAQNASRRLVQIIGRDFCNRCDMVITPSRLVLNYLQRIGVKVPISTIPTGIELEEFENTDPAWLQKNYHVDPRHKVLLFVGRLGQEKNIVFLLKAFEKVLQSYPDCVLVIVGKGPQESYLKELCHQLRIAGRVIFTGVLPRHKLVHCYASSHLFVFPSVTETQGLVIGEAKAAGLPVVAIRAFGPAESVVHGEDGFLTDPSIPSFTEAILNLLRDEQLYRRMKEKALANVHLISSGHCAEQMLSLYQSLLDKYN
ncbi:MAG: glycosyltransferase family 4 protein [Dethiobacteria bacterium]|jgi:glycosyltransferase involved in cell wall biosynthesis|nr:glycosyltransferase family 4 protein [Bacillota bacterium]HOP69585.1 glycosyltransferase family 4 protein [Bacillota bacterium]HPT34514.1 glycosyltransferase family 4 protein [Bacillota bacterium]HPZ64740.1 glycosyltransferase family 4 protein [Bacillota bacterium]HQD06394.1 glycosyltransferase family 4 protein [Bacillota bacterium]